MLGASKGIFVGYDKYSPAYLIYFPESGKVSRVRCVKFTSNFQSEEECPLCPVPSELCEEFDDDLVKRPTVQVANTESENEQEVVEAETPEIVVEQEAQADVNMVKTPEKSNETAPVRRYPNRQHDRQPQHLEDYVVGSNIDDISRV